MGVPWRFDRPPIRNSPRPFSNLGRCFVNRGRCLTIRSTTDPKFTPILCKSSAILDAERGIICDFQLSASVTIYPRVQRCKPRRGGLPIYRPIMVRSWSGKKSAGRSFLEAPANSPVSGGTSRPELTPRREGAVSGPMNAAISLADRQSETCACSYSRITHRFESAHETLGTT